MVQKIKLVVIKRVFCDKYEMVFRCALWYKWNEREEIVVIFYGRYARNYIVAIMLVFIE